MKTTLFSLISLLIWGLLTPAVAQQEGSVAIASAIRPPTDTAFQECVITLVERAKVTSKEAIAACNKNGDRLAKTTTRLANEAADATKASRPMVVSPYGYGYDSYYRSGYESYGYGSGGRAIMRRRQTPPSRQPPPLRPSQPR